MAAAHILYEIKNLLFTNLAKTYFSQDLQHKVLSKQNFCGTLHPLQRHTVWETLLHGMLETCGSFVTKLSRLDPHKERKIIHWCRTQTSSHRSQGFVYGWVNEAGVSTEAPDRSALLCYGMDQN